MQKELGQIEIERRRGFIVWILYLAHPNPLSLRSLCTVLDKKDISLSFGQLAKLLDVLCGLELVRVFPIDSNEDLNCVQQDKLIQKYIASDGEMGDDIYARIRNKGIHFHEGYDYPDVRGVTRKN